nr:MAG TPA: hypothetical protein [Caudoviricetes sp.]
MADKNKVIQLLDPGTGGKVSPVVNVGSIYDKKGQKIDNLLSYKVSGMDVPIPEIKSIEDMLNARIDAKLTELDAAVSKIEKAAESGANVVVTAKVKNGETVEQFMPVDVENGECYTGMKTGPIEKHAVHGKIVSMISKNEVVTIEISGDDVIAHIEDISGNITNSATLTIKPTKTGSRSRIILNSFVMPRNIIYILVWCQNSTAIHFVRVEVSNSGISINLVNTVSGKQSARFSHIQNDHMIFTSLEGTSAELYLFDTSNDKLSKLTFDGKGTYSWMGDAARYDSDWFAINDTTMISTHYLYKIDNGNVVTVGSNNLNLGQYCKLLGCVKVSDNQFILLTANYEMYFVLYNVKIDGSSISTLSTLDIIGSSSSSYNAGLTGIAKADNDVYAICKNLSTEKFMLHKISYSSNSLSIEKSTEVCNSPLDEERTCDTIFYSNGAFLLTYDKNYNSSDYNFHLLPYKGEFYGSLTPSSKMALALNSANSGGNVDVVYSGILRNINVAQGFYLNTGNFIAESPTDKTLIVSRSNIDLAGQTEIISYTGTGNYGASNPCSVTFGFTPKIVKLLGSTANGWTRLVDASYNTEIVIDLIPDEYKQYMGFYAENTSSRSYARFDKKTNTLYWYNTNDYSSQVNSRGETYYLIAIK